MNNTLGGAWSYSQLGQKFRERSGITYLMDDLNQGLLNPEAIMLGGGNPAAIPEMEAYLNRACRALLDEGHLCRAISNYDGPEGQSAFRRDLAGFLRRQYGWPITERNITLTNGSQNSFFYLFNILAGRRPDGSHKKILLPLTPEYIGYFDLGIEEPIFASCAPKVEFLGDQLFKYHIDFDKLPTLHTGSSIAAICASRPTNPTGNVLTDEELERLSALAKEQNIPLILDNAYGTPFPDIIFTEARPFWDENCILCLSLSKLGLPGLRCGIVVASEELCRILANMNGIIGLAPGSLGPALAHYMLRNDDLLRLSREIVQPFYRKKSRLALDIVRELLCDERVRIHKSEGAMFLWLWFDELPISTIELYRRLKARGLLVVPGEYFFPQREDPKFQLPHQCLRINYVREAEQLRRGIQILAEEVERAYGQNQSEAKGATQAATQVVTKGAGR